MGLFGSYTPKGENPVSFPLRVLDQARFLGATSEIKTDFASGKPKSEYELSLGKRLAPYTNTFKTVGMAYEIITYPLLENTPDGTEIRNLVRDAQAHPNERLEEFPNRGAIALTTTDRKVLSMITQARGLPLDPTKRVYHYIDLIPRVDAWGAAIMRRHESALKGNALDAGMLRERGEIDREIQERQNQWPRHTTGPKPPKR